MTKLCKNFYSRNLLLDGNDEKNKSIDVYMIVDNSYSHMVGKIMYDDLYEKRVDLFLKRISQLSCNLIDFVCCSDINIKNYSKTKLLNGRLVFMSENFTFESGIVTHKDIFLICENYM